MGEIAMAECIGCARFRQVHYYTLVMPGDERRPQMRFTGAPVCEECQPPGAMLVVPPLFVEMVRDELAALRGEDGIN